MMGIANKLKSSEINERDPEAAQLLETLLEGITEYVIFSSEMYKQTNMLGLFNAFINKFLNFHAYVGNNKGLNIPSYDPFKIAFTQDTIDDEVVSYWIALWTNAFIVYSEYEESHDKDGLLFAVRKDYYDEHMKKERPNLDGNGEQ